MKLFVRSSCAPLCTAASLLHCRQLPAAEGHACAWRGAPARVVDSGLLHSSTPFHPPPPPTAKLCSTRFLRPVCRLHACAVQRKTLVIKKRPSRGKSRPLPCQKRCSPFVPLCSLQSILPSGEQEMLSQKKNQHNNKKKEGKKNANSKHAQFCGIEESVVGCDSSLHHQPSLPSPPPKKKTPLFTHLFYPLSCILITS